MIGQRYFIAYIKKLKQRAVKEFGCTNRQSSELVYTALNDTGFWEIIEGWAEYYKETEWGHKNK